MKRAVISDIHSNLEAFDAVLVDMKNQGVEDIICLGDLVGYGPNPIECIDKMMNLEFSQKVCLLGNHDQATLFDPDGFNTVAEQAIFWTREVLETARDRNAQERWQFLGELPRYYRDKEFLFVHGSPRNPLNEYVFAEDIHELEKMEKLFAIIPQYCFQGHTHVPGIFTEDLNYYAFADLEDHCFELGQQKLMINVGSVGQSRDRDPRACYVIIDSEKGYIEYRRVDYDIDITHNKICAIPDLADFLAERIKLGK